MNHISWNTTQKCNLYCKHCYRDSGPDKLKNELSNKESKKLLREIKQAGFRIIVFSGGEPLLRDDIFDLISYSKSLGMRSLMGSNGTLITKRVARKLKECGLDYIAVSIDSLNPKKHDEFRGVKGSFNRAVKGIKNCIEKDIKVQVNCTLTKDNLKEIDDIIEFSKELKVSSCHMLFLVDIGRGKNINQMNKSDYKTAINKIISKEIDIRAKPTCAPQYKVEALINKKEKPQGRGCIAGISYCSILPNGDVHICPYADVKVANIREESFDSIWENNQIFKDLRDFTKYKGKCGKCKYINICGGCRARAFNNSGDWLGEDPYCLLD